MKIIQFLEQFHSKTWRGTKRYGRSRIVIRRFNLFLKVLTGALCPIYLFLCLLLVNGCGRDKSQTNRGTAVTADTARQSLVQRDSRLQSLTIAGVPLFVETAQTETERQRGLMFREHLPPDQGMLFIFPVSQIQSFWMRNTFIPLDIAFIDRDGVIVDIQHMKPVDESVLYTSRAPALYALEVNAGWFAQHGIEAGARVNF